MEVERKLALEAEERQGMEDVGCQGKLANIIFHLFSK